MKKTRKSKIWNPDPILWELGSSGAPMTLFAEISAGELIDKITILEIKLDRIRDEGKRANIARELAGLTQALDRNIGGNAAVADLRRELKSVNAELWRIEDDIRAQERRQDFGPAFVSLARSVYRINDRRAELKRQVNVVTRSALVEEKSYAAY